MIKQYTPSALPTLPKQSTFEHTRVALAVFDAGKRARAEAWRVVDSRTDLDAADAAEQAAERLVQEAFYEDTKHLNSLDSCLRISVNWMRALVERNTPANGHNSDPKE